MADYRSAYVEGYKAGTDLVEHYILPKCPHEDKNSEEYYGWFLGFGESVETLFGEDANGRMIYEFLFQFKEKLPH